MPRYSEKQQNERVLEVLACLQQIESTMAMIDDDEDMSGDSDSDKDDVLLSHNLLLSIPWTEVYNASCSRRYLDRAQKVARAPSRIHWLFNELDEQRFIQEVRMSKDAFLILDLIKENAIFVSSGQKPQKSVFVQLLVALRRLGFYGNGASIGNVARYSGIGEGSVINYTNRCIEAILALESTYIQWPNDAEKSLSKSDISRGSAFEDCIGIIDGTLFPFASEPCIQPQSYFSYKKKYGISGILVCNSQKQIIYSYVGWPGSTHDSRIFSNSALRHHPEQYFKPEEYLLGDSGFECLPNVIVPFKKPRNGSLTDEQEMFNYKLSSVRIRIEHTIGMLKMRFQSLRELPLRLIDEEDAKPIIHWIKACFVLHNIITKHNLEDMYDDEELRAVVDDQQEQQPENNANWTTPNSDRMTPGKARREELFHHVIHNHN